MAKVKIKIRGGRRQGHIFQDRGQIIVEVMGPNDASKAKVLAHELAHLKLGHLFRTFSSWDEFNQREQDANLLAKKGKLRHLAQQIVKKAGRKSHHLRRDTPQDEETD